MFRRTIDIKGETVAIRFEGQRLPVPAGETVAAAILANDQATRERPSSAEQRAHLIA